MKIYFTTIKIFVTSFIIYAVVMWIITRLYYKSEITYDKFLYFFYSYGLMLHVAIFSLLTSLSIFKIKVVTRKTTNESDTLDDLNFMTKKSESIFDSLAKASTDIFQFSLIMFGGVLVHLLVLRFNFSELCNEDLLFQLHKNSEAMIYCYCYSIPLGFGFRDFFKVVDSNKKFHV